MTTIATAGRVAVHNGAMSEMSFLTLPESVQIAAIAQLLRQVPAMGTPPSSAAAAVLVVLQADHPWALRTSAAVQHIPATCIQLDLHASPDAVSAAIAQHRPHAVVCDARIFGWVSKLAFTQQVTAVFTCDEQGEGTLLDRARHLVPAGD